MKKHAISTIVALALLLSGTVGGALAQVNTDYHDGPYITVADDTIQIKWIERGLPRDTAMPLASAGLFERPGLPVVDLADLDIVADTAFEFGEVRRFIALSDVHGQFDIFAALLQAQGVTDAAGDWAFGQDHLVVVGDHFSRGDKVLEILWCLFRLEKQARQAGGRVHVLLGNHELMTLNSDLRYINRKYAYTSGLLRVPYSDLFTAQSVLGQWLRRKNVALVINEVLFVHGGLSEAAVNRSLGLGEMNAFFRDVILSADGKALSQDEQVSFLIGDDGPLWYRGYADTLGFEERAIDKVLDFYRVSHVVVGHTGMPTITGRFDNKILLIDCGILFGERGEALLWEAGRFHRGQQDGTRVAMSPEPKASGKGVTLFKYVDDMAPAAGRPKFVFKTDVKAFLNNKLKEVYQPCELSLLSGDGSPLLAVKGRVRTRGNTRKQVCRLPPLKFDCNKKELAALGFLKVDKLKLVLPCRRSKTDQEKLYKEFFLYQLYGLIDTAHIRATLVDVQLSNPNGKAAQDFTGILIEDDEAYAARCGARVLGKRGPMATTALHREHFLKMFFFQYMIGNTDWAVPNRHNLLFASLPGSSTVLALPYDFDYSGFVNQNYAVPHESLPIASVRQRYFMPYPVSDDELRSMIDFFKGKEAEIIAFCETATYMKPKSIVENKAYLAEFFKMLDRPESLKQGLALKSE